MTKAESGLPEHSKSEEAPEQLELFPSGRNFRIKLETGNLGITMMPGIEEKKNNVVGVLPSTAVPVSSPPINYPFGPSIRIEDNVEGGSSD